MSQGLALGTVLCTGTRSCLPAALPPSGQLSKPSQQAALLGAVIRLLCRIQELLREIRTTEGSPGPSWGSRPWTQYPQGLESHRNGSLAARPLLLGLVLKNSVPGTWACLTAVTRPRDDVDGEWPGDWKAQGKEQEVSRLVADTEAGPRTPFQEERSFGGGGGEAGRPVPCKPRSLETGPPPPPWAPVSVREEGSPGLGASHHDADDLGSGLGQAEPPPGAGATQAPLCSWEGAQLSPAPSSHGGGGGDRGSCGPGTARASMFPTSP